MAYHITIQQERRTATETPMGIDTSRLALDIADQLHTLSSENLADKDWSAPQFVMVAEWDLRSPFVIVHKGDYSARTMGYAGWPDVTEAQYAAQEVLEGRT